MPGTQLKKLENGILLTEGKDEEGGPSSEMVKDDLILI